MEKTKLIVAVALLVVAVGTVALVIWPRKGPLGKRSGAIETVCGACGHLEVQELFSVPDVCSQCGEKKVFPAVRCPKCGAAIPLVTIVGPQRGGAQITCPECGYQFAPHAPASTR